MANWCSNKINFTGNKNELDELFTKLDTVETEPDFYHSDHYVENREKVLRKDENGIFLWVESKWEPPLDFLENICVLYPSVTADVKYKEQGCDIAGHAIVTRENINQATFGYWEGLYSCWGSDDFFEEVESHAGYCDYEMGFLQELIVECSGFLPDEDLERLINMIMSLAEENSESKAA